MNQEANSEEKTGGLTLFYTTAEDNRPTYRRGILDALCYPKGHILEYSYRLHNLHPQLRKEEANTSQCNTEGVIIFVDVDYAKQSGSAPSGGSMSVTYFPLRRVTITKFPSLKPGHQVNERERVSYFLELGDFVHYVGSEKENQWHDRIAALDPLRSFRGEVPQYFVIPGIDIPSSSNAIQTAWEDVVTAVSKSARLRAATFMRVDYLREVGKNIAILPKPFADERVYDLRPGRVYRLNFCVFESPTGPGGGRESVVNIRSSSSGLLQVDRPYQSAVSGLSERSALVACKRTVEKTIAVLSIEAGDSTQAVVNSPNPILFVRLSLPRLTVFGFALLIFLGGFLVSLDSKVVPEMSLFFSDCATQYPEFWALSSKLIGAACLTLAAWLAFRELPSKGM